MSSLSSFFPELLPVSTFLPDINGSFINFKFAETFPSSSVNSVPRTSTKSHPSGSLRLSNLSFLPTTASSAPGPSGLVPLAAARKVSHHQGPQEDEAPAAPSPLDNQNGSELDSQHSLPLPQAMFAHLCTVMSRMHHRREGYPFGSLVDFAPGSTGPYVGDDFKRILKQQKVSSGIPSGRFGHSCVVVGDSLVLFGGINDHVVWKNDTWVGKLVFHEAFDVTLSWRLLDMGSVATLPRDAQAGCSIDKKQMHIYGGIGPSGDRLGDTWVLHLSENHCCGTWQEIAACPYPPPRSGHSLTHIGGTKTILFGGRGTHYDVLNEVWLFEPYEGYWRWVLLVFDSYGVPQGLSLPRVGHSATLILGGVLLIYGGEESYGHRSFHQACADNSGRNVYVFGGMVDGLPQPAEALGLRFDSGLFLVERVCFELSVCSKLKRM